MRLLSCLFIIANSFLLIACDKKVEAESQQTTANLNFTKQWSKVNGGSSYDQYWAGWGTVDGGYIAAGYTASNDGDMVGLKGQTDALTVKYDAAGNRTWQTLIGGSGQDYATAITQLPDGSFAGVGYSRSSDGDVISNHGGRDGIIFKLASNGVVQWVKALGSSNNEAARSMVVNNDGTFTIAGYRANPGDEIASFDAWLCKADASGNVMWEKTYGGSNLDNVVGLTSDGNGGFVFVGYSSSTDGDASGNDGGANDYWVVKVDALGNKQWHKTFGGSGVDWAHDIVKTNNGFFVLGKSNSNDGDVTGLHGGFDAWLLKIDNNGNKLFQQTLGGTANEHGQGLLTTSDGGILVGVNAQSANGTFSSNFGFMDVWVVKLDENGNNLGQKGLGGSGSDEIFGFAKNGNSYSVLGSTNSSDGDIAGYMVDFTRSAWILKFND